MNLVDDFDDLSTDARGRIVITDKEIADLRYSLIDSAGGERIVPLRWHTFRVFDARLVIHAATDQLPSSIYEMSVVLDYLKRVATVEIVDADSVGHYADWPMKSDMRADLFKAVKVLARHRPGKWEVRERSSGSGNFNKWDVS